MSKSIEELEAEIVRKNDMIKYLGDTALAYEAKLNSIREIVGNVIPSGYVKVGVGLEQATLNTIESLKKAGDYGPTSVNRSETVSE